MAFSAHKTEEEIKEFYDTKEDLEKKAKELASLIKKSKHFTCFTGAGVSTSAGIPDFRGPTGVWTLKAKGLSRKGRTTSTLKAIPTVTHMSLVKLQNEGRLKFLISQNCDGLHRRSGILPQNISELHGNGNREKCSECGKEYMRDYKASSPYHTSVHDHKTGRTCDLCGGDLEDSIINFGESLDSQVLQTGFDNADKSDLQLVLGSSLTVSPANEMPRRVGERKNSKLVICNLQKTPLDKYASIRVFAKTDDLMKLVMKELGFEIPSFILRRRIRVEQKPDEMVISGVDVDGIPSTFIAGLKSNQEDIEEDDHGQFRVKIDLSGKSKTQKVEVYFMGHYNEPPVTLEIPFMKESIAKKNNHLYEMLYNPLNGKWEIELTKEDPEKTKLVFKKTDARCSINGKPNKPIPKETIAKYLSNQDLFIIDAIPCFNQLAKNATKKSKPAPRSAACCFAFGDKIYQFGGFTEVRGDRKYFNDMHCFDLKEEKWSKVDVKGDVPEPRSGASCSMVGDKVYVFAGSKYFVDKGYFNDVHVFNPADHSWKKLDIKSSLPPKRSFHSASVIGNDIYYFGGSTLTDNVFYNDMWKFNTVDLKFEQVGLIGDIPCARDGMSATVIGNKIIFIGGYHSNDAGMEFYHNDVYSFCVDKNEFTKLKVKAEGGFNGKSWHSATKVFGDKILLFGGCGQGFICNDLFLFATDINKMFKLSQVKGRSPTPRYFHQNVVVGDKIYIVSGAGIPYTKQDYNNDIHCLSLE